MTGFFTVFFHFSNIHILVVLSSYVILFSYIVPSSYACIPFISVFLSYFFSMSNLPLTFISSYFSVELSSYFCCTIFCLSSKGSHLTYKFLFRRTFLLLLISSYFHCTFVVLSSYFRRTFIVLSSYFHLTSIVLSSYLFLPLLAGILPMSYVVQVD